jgi:hypothetical protein
MVSLPGMMTRQILGGVPLAESVKSDPRNVPAEEWDPSGLVRLAVEFGCQLINNHRSPLGCD